MEFPKFNALVREWVSGEASDLGAEVDQALGEDASPTAAAGELAAAEHLFDFSPVGAWEGKSLLQLTMPAIRHTAKQFHRLEAQVRVCVRAPMFSSVSSHVCVTLFVCRVEDQHSWQALWDSRNLMSEMPNWNGHTNNNVG